MDGINKMSQTALTSPADKVEEIDYRTRVKIPPLTDVETKEAMTDLYSDEFLEKFPKVERLYADPPAKADHITCLHSFSPAEGATPDKDGVFGMMKCRGNFATKEEANQRGKWLIKNVDSYHKILTGWCGRPFPVCVDANRWTEETAEVDIKKKATDVVSSNIRKNRQEEVSEMKEMKDREKKLLEESNRDEVPVEERYTTLRVKKANLVHTIVETMKKMKMAVKSLNKANEEIAEIDEEDPSQKEEVYERYMDARNKAGIPNENSESSFINYICEDEQTTELVNKLLTGLKQLEDVEF